MTNETLEVIKSEMSAEEIETFGDMKDVTVETLDAYALRCKESGREMDLFIESLPNWVDDSEYFNLYLMTAKERARWMEKNSPYLKAGSSAKPIQVGGMRI